MRIPSIPTRGRTLDYAASIYDLLEPVCLLNKQAEYDRTILDILALQPTDKILDIGCGTGVLCQMIAQQLQPENGGTVTGIDAAGKMIEVARKKRGNDHCLFEPMAAENLTFDDESFDSVVSSLFYHHVPLDLKKQSLSEAFRVLKPGGTGLHLEHVRSKKPVLGELMDILNPAVVRMMGANINRDTAGNIRRSGLQILEEKDLWLDILKMFTVTKGQKLQ